MSLQIKAARTSYHPQMRGMRGDPGLFGGLIGAIKGGVGSLFSGGNPITGAISGAVSGFKGKSRPAPPALPAPRTIAAPVTRTPGVGGAVARAIPGGSTGYQVAVPANGKPPSGFHWNKSDYFLRDGTFVPAGTKLVKNRRRNPANPRALDRAIGRLNSAKRLQSKLSGFSTSKYTASGKKKSC